MYGAVCSYRKASFLLRRLQATELINRVADKFVRIKAITFYTTVHQIVRA